MDLLSKMDNVSSIPIPVSYPSQTFYVTFGKEKAASNALKEVSSMLMASVLPLVPNVTPLTRPQETA